VQMADETTQIELFELLVSASATCAAGASDPGVDVPTILSRVAKASCERWDRERAILGVSLLKTFDNVLNMLGRGAPIPAMVTSLENVFGRLRRNLDSTLEVDSECLEAWAAVIRFCSRHCPALLEAFEQEDTRGEIAANLIRKIEDELQSDPAIEDADAVFAEADRLDSIAGSLKIIPAGFKVEEKALQELADELETQAERYREETYAGEPDGDVLAGGGSGGSADVSIQEIFSDL